MKAKDLVEKAGDNYTIKCQRCRYVVLVSSRAKVREKCPQCGCKYTDPAPIETHAPEDTSPSTHNQVRILCMKCNKKFLIWIKKGKYAPTKCPSCEYSGIRLVRKKISEAGECAERDMWGPPRYRPKKFHRLKKVRCLHCKIFSTDPVCPRCGGRTR